MADNDEERRRALVAKLDARNEAMLARVKRSGMQVRPKHLDKIAPPRNTFNRGRKRTI